MKKDITYAMTNAEVLSALGENLRRMRINADLTQRELSEKADISLAAIRNAECGRGATMLTLVKMLRHLRRFDCLESLNSESEIRADLLFERQTDTIQRVRKPKNEKR